MSKEPTVSIPVSEYNRMKKEIEDYRQRNIELGEKLKNAHPKELRKRCERLSENLFTETFKAILEKMGFKYENYESPIYCQTKFGDDLYKTITRDNAEVRIHINLAKDIRKAFISIGLNDDAFEKISSDKDYLTI
jgi:hypothetical protein